MLRVLINSDCGCVLIVDIDLIKKGLEVWAVGVGLYDCKGNKIFDLMLLYNFVIWWDGDFFRELLDKINVYKWDYNINLFKIIFIVSGCLLNNGIKVMLCLSVDILGDWCEEVIF